MAHSGNRREFYRFVVDVAGIFRVSRDLIWLPCQVLDVSGCGARIGTLEAIDEEATLHVEVTLSTGTYRRYAAIVGHEHAESQTWHKYRLQWIRQTEKEQDALIHALFAHERAKRTPIVF